MREQCISLAALVEAARCDLRDQIEGRGITPQPHDPPAEDEDPILPSPGLLNEQQPAIGERASSKLAGIAIGLVRLMARLNEQSHRSRVGALPVS
jgi:hypothetical protein